jgi:hypothetical protein
VPRELVPGPRIAARAHGEGDTTVIEVRPLGGKHHFNVDGVPLAELDPVARGPRCAAGADEPHGEDVVADPGGGVVVVVGGGANGEDTAARGQRSGLRSAAAAAQGDPAAALGQDRRGEHHGHLAHVAHPHRRRPAVARHREQRREFEDARARGD